jgi:hypothetical protein
MKKLMTAAFALCALFVVSGKAHADVHYPWCLMGDTRGYECVFSTREQCMQDGRNRGFGSQCIQNPYYKPGSPTVSGIVKGPPTVSGPVKKRTVSQTARPSQAVNAAHSTCTGMKSVCLSFPHWVGVGLAVLEGARPYNEKACNFYWEKCMKTGWWEGYLQHRSAERR